MTALRSAAFYLPIILLVFWWTAPASAQDPPQTDKTFYKDILPVFQRTCIECHHPGGSAPQSLTTYEEARSWLRASKRMMREGTMPPWHAKAGPEVWTNAILPTDEEIALVVDWIDARAPEGDPADAPAPLDFSAPWLLGDPDRVLTVEEPVAIPANAPDFYRTWILDPAFETDTWLSGIELKPTAKSRVLALTLSAVPPGVADSIPADAFDWPAGADGKYGIAVWTRGMTPARLFPDDAGVLIPTGWKFLLQAHYHAGDDPAEDRPEIGLHLAAEPPARDLETLVIENREIDLPEFTYNGEVSAARTLEHPIAIHALYPVMNYLAHSAEITALPVGDAGPRPILELEDYKTQFRAVYVPVEPIQLDAGTELRIDALYDNSPDNPNNPNPTLEPAGYGPAPADEMLKLVVLYTER